MASVDQFLDSYQMGGLSWLEMQAVVRSAFDEGEPVVSEWRQALEGPAGRALPADKLQLLLDILSGGDIESSDVIEPPPSLQESGYTPGQTINERYVLEELLGGGGMGNVFKARDLQAEKHMSANPYVALKTLTPEIRDDEQARIALHREVERARLLAHENIVSVFSFEEDASNGVPFFTMEFLLGQPLEAILDERPSGLSLDEARPIIGSMCAGIGAAHRQRIVHSDIKPSNVLLTEGQVKILDFGIASPLRHVDVQPAQGRTRIREDASRDTHYNPRKLGALSPRYAPAEMWLGLEPDVRDDVYSAACVIYELLSGRHPYGGVEAPQAKENGLKPTPLTGLSESQNTVLLRGLELDRQDRLESIEQLAEELLRVVQSDSMVDRLAGIVRRWAPMITAAFVAIGLLIGLLFVGRDTEDPPAPPPMLSEDAYEPQLIDAPGELPADPAPTLVDTPSQSDPWSDDNCYSAFMSCADQQACFSDRVKQLEFASSVAPESRKPMLTAQIDMNERLAGTLCDRIPAVRAQEYSAFQRDFPGFRPYE